jgi:hypothetical protein
MISLEQIRLLESKISRAIELIRVLKDENGTLRKGLESAQKRMKELESLVDGFKTDQREIESVIVRTLHNLDELEESTAAKRGDQAGAAAAASPAPAAPASPAPMAHAGPSPAAGQPSAARAEEPRAPRRPPVEAVTEQAEARSAGLPKAQDLPAAKEELDIF